MTGHKYFDVEEEIDES